MAAWMILTVRTRQRAIVHAGARIVNQADAPFTVPGVLLIFLKGMALAPAFGGGNPFWQPIRLSLPMNFTHLLVRVE
jgi:uncharacterized membrane protein